MTSARNIETNPGYSPSPIPIDPDSLLSEAQTSVLTGVSVRTLQGWRLKGGGPRVVKCGRAVRYRRRDLVSWMDENTVSSTSDEA